jgi:hypothetical protein
MGKRNEYRLLVDNPLRKWLLERLRTWKVAIKVDIIVVNQTVRVNGTSSGSRLKVSFDAGGIEPSGSYTRELVMKSCQNFM